MEKSLWQFLRKSQVCEQTFSWISENFDFLVVLDEKSEDVIHPVGT